MINYYFDLPVKHVTTNLSLLDTGFVVEKIDKEIPNLYSCLFKILMPQMYEDAWDELTKNLPLTKRMKAGTCIFVMSEKAQNYCNCLISNVHTSTEKTCKTHLLYTDDEDFDIIKLPRITKEEQFNNVKKGITSFIKPDNTYVIKTTTIFMSGINKNCKNKAEDIIFYIPRRSLYV